MTTLTCYSRPALSRIEERALLNTPANLSFKFDDTLHARGARSLDSCQDTKENPGQMIMIKAKYSVDDFIFTYLYHFFFFTNPFNPWWNLLCAALHYLDHFLLLICQYCLFSSSPSSSSLNLFAKNHCQVASWCPEVITCCYDWSE